MTLPLEQSMERERAKPVELVARAIYGDWAWETSPETDAEVDAAAAWDEKVGNFDYPACTSRDEMRRNAKDALACLVSHGFITIEGLLAMKAETDSQSPNGEATNGA